MTTTVLAYLPSPSQGVWYLGPVPIRAYALCIIIGIVAALIIGDRRWAARGGEPGVIYDIALWAVPFGLLGGRLYHVMTDWPKYFGPEGRGVGAALAVWEGGLGIWGAVALGAVGAWIGCKRRGIPLPAFGDAIAPGIILAQAVGRIGNYFNQELYGRETTLPWGLEIYQRLDANGVRNDLTGVSTGQVLTVVHPTFLYELLWNLLVFGVLLWADRRFKLGHGRLFALYVAGYCVGRFWIELMRSDFASEPIGGIRVNTLTSAFVLIGAVVYMMLAPKGREDPASLAGKGASDDQSTGDELGKELVAAAAGTGVVAAATVAGHEDVDDADHMHPDEVTADEGADAAAAIEMKGIVGGPDDAEATADVPAESADEAPETDKAATESDEPDAESEEADAEDVVEGDSAVEPDTEAESTSEPEPVTTEVDESPADEEPSSSEPDEAPEEPEEAQAAEVAVDTDEADTDVDAEPAEDVAAETDTAADAPAESTDEVPETAEAEQVATEVDESPADEEAPEPDEVDDADEEPEEAQAAEVAVDTDEADTDVDAEPAEDVAAETDTAADAPAESTDEAPEMAEAEQVATEVDESDTEPGDEAEEGSPSEPDEVDAEDVVEGDSEPEAERAEEVTTETDKADADVVAVKTDTTPDAPAKTPEPETPSGGRVRRWLRRRNH